jgi:tryptophan-rich sensory protein
MSVGVRLVVFGLVIAALWDLFTTFHGVSAYFDLPMNPKINPAQFIFGLIVTIVVFGFVFATHYIWSLEPGDGPALLLKAAWAICVAINLITSWEGTKRFIFYGDEGDPARDAGLAIVTALIVSSAIFLSKLLFSKPGGTKLLDI